MVVRSCICIRITSWITSACGPSINAGKVLSASVQTITIVSRWIIDTINIYNNGCC
nr:hypothetical protein [Acinetobacter baumannii]